MTATLQLHRSPFAAAITAAQVQALAVHGLHYGCGQQLVRGWINADREPLRVDGQPVSAGENLLGLTDARGCAWYLQHRADTPLPFADGALARVHSEHFIEHIPPSTAIAWLRDVHRVLRPGGLLRLTTPDLERYVRGYLNPGDGFYARHRDSLNAQQLAPALGEASTPDRPAWMLNQIFRYWGHCWIYDEAELRHALMQAGFADADIRRAAFGVGSDPVCAALDRPLRADETLYIEARR